MYSVVLMAALTTGVDLPDLGRRGGCFGCYGCWGCRGGCWGCWGCRGGCWGCWGCCGCWGGCWGCYGCYGGVVYYGCHGCYGGVVVPYHHHHPAPHPKTPEKAPPPKEKRSGQLDTPAPATIVVELPADAKLLIDDEATTSTGSNRVFQSPALNPGKEYHYTLKAEVIRDGKPIQAEQVVTVKAGETTPVRLILPSPGVAQR